MKIERLKLTNFRNYANLELELNPNINIFIGDNGQGKTNILESIYILSLTKTNRQCQEDEIIKFDEEIAMIEGIIKNDTLIKKKKVAISKNKKQLFINSKEIHRSRDYIKDFSIISFTPNDLEIVKGSPNIRRNMMNIDISQLHNNYITFLNEYNKIIKIRNDYLKKMNLNGNSDIKYLEIINEELINKAIKIFQFRFDFLNKINKIIASVFKKTTGIDGLSIIYNNSINQENFNEEEIRKKLNNKFKKVLNIELMQGMTTIGPHRDDFSFVINGSDMKYFSSQGQQRMAIIALKISEIYLFKEEKGEYPVLLLDDIFSEIDIKKRNKIIKFLNNDIQTIITTTDIYNINEKILENANIYTVIDNEIKKGRKKYGRKRIK